MLSRFYTQIENPCSRSALAGPSFPLLGGDGSTLRFRRLENGLQILEVSRHDGGMDLLPSRYERVEPLAESRGTQLVRARLSGRDVVVRLDDAGPAGSEALQELAVLSAVEHPGLAQLVDYGEHAGRLFVTRDWVDGASLAERRPDQDEERVRILAQVCSALRHLHERGFVHRDLKSDNVLIRASDGQAVLSDYGFASRDSVAEQGVSGSWFSIAPEVLRGGRATAASDLFALGVLIYELLLGPPTVPPSEFYASFPERSFFEAVGASPDDLPSWARDVVCRLLEIEPGKRPTSPVDVARTLAGRLGVEIVDRSEGLTLTEGRARDSWYRDLVARATDAFS